MQRALHPSHPMAVSAFHVPGISKTQNGIERKRYFCNID
jgi:hypothetical protein